MLENGFPEHASVESVKRLARRFADSRLAIYVTGEVGTGRRTLATALAALRADGGPVVEVGAGQPFSADPAGVVLVHHPELLDAVAQVTLAAAIRAGARVVAWGSQSFVATAHLELRPHLGSAIVELPPIRERGADAIAWAHHFGERRSGQTVPFTREADTVIGAYHWPGNLTEIDAVVARALSLRDGDAPVDVDDLGLDDVTFDLEPLADAVDRFRREYVRRALERLGGNRTRTAKALGIDARTVFR